MSVLLPLRQIVDGREWRLFSYRFESADGAFLGYIYAISPEHAAALLEEMKGSATLLGEMVEL